MRDKIKVLSAVALAMIIAVSFASVLSNDAYAEPTIGVEQPPFKDPALFEEGYIGISTRAELEKIGIDSDYPIDGKYYLKDDITDLSNFVPIGPYNNPFIGILDGNGYKITNLSPKPVTTKTGGETEAAEGLFGHLGDGAEIHNLGISGYIYNNSTLAGDKYLGGLVGSVIEGASVKIMNCYTQGVWILGWGATHSLYAGGIVAINFGTVYMAGCYSGLSTGNVIEAAGNVVAGGLIGMNVGNADIYGCWNLAKVRSGSTTGGLVGESSGTLTIANSYNKGYMETVNGSIYATDIEEGDFIDGHEKPAASIAYSGGMVAHVSGGTVTIKECYNSGRQIITSEKNIYVGGLVGAVTGDGVCTITDAYNVGNATLYSGSDAYASGIIGYLEQAVTVTNCYNAGYTKVKIAGGSTATVGEIIGHAPAATITNCYYLINQMTVNKVIMNQIGPDVSKLDGTNTNDPRPGIQGSGAKSAAELASPLDKVRSGDSIYFIEATGKVKGWNFEKIWTINVGENNGFPVFKLSPPLEDLDKPEESIEYNVTVNGGTADVYNGVTGEKVTLEPGTPAPGKIFKEWFVNSGDVTILENIFFIGTSDVEITAIWDDVVYTVTVTDGSASPIEGKMGTTVTLTADAPHAGMKFKEWNVISGGVTVAVDNTFVIGTANVVIEAVYENIIYTVTVTGGSASPASGIMGAVVKLTADSPAPGKIFKEWLVVSGGVKITDDEFVIGTSNVEISAVWDDVVYTVTVTDGSASPIEGKMGTTITLTADAPQAGMKFKEWNVISGGVTVAVDNTFVIGTANVVIEAAYENIIYTVTVNGGSSSPVSGIMGTVVKLTADSPAPGKIFKEWLVVSGGVKITDDEFVIGTSNVEISAVWEDIVYTVTVTGGSASPASGIMGAVVKLTADSPAPGKIFKEWLVVSGGVKITDDEFVIGTSNVKISAVWEDIVYTVKVNGGSSSPVSGIMGAVVKLTADSPASGKIFKEWLVASGGVKITDDEFVIGTSDVEITAIWEDIGEIGPRTIEPAINDDTPGKDSFGWFIPVMALLLLFLFLLIGRSFEKIEIGPIDNKEYTGSQIRPTPWVKYYGKLIEAGEDFVFSYGENEDVGYGTLTVTLINGYDGEAAAAFRIVDEKV
ncbi:MAG: hypothetical protein LBE48_02710 [Methanomassiliicoccaceae archaeon]|jgi:hypothetical protein|nr:hypothetical protein [Methanomassiliicoccaceae archaeon]